LCPTAPDTLRSFPYRDGDPFVIDKAPDVFFAGCQEKYASEVIKKFDDSHEAAVKIISVPTFAKTLSIVVLDI